MKVDYSKVRYGRVAVFWVDVPFDIADQAREAGAMTRLWQNKRRLYRSTVPVIAPRRGRTEGVVEGLKAFEKWLADFDGSQNDWIAVAEGKV